MNKKYFFINSKDIDLLIVLFISLEMEGFKNDKYWNDYNNPVYYDLFNWLCVLETGTRDMTFHFHDGCDNPTRLLLTEENFNKVFTQIRKTL